MAAKLSEVRKPKDEEETKSGAMPTKKVVTDLSTEVGALNQKMAKARGEMGAAIKSAESDHNVHRGAFRQAMKEKQMEPEARADFQRHLAKYRRDLNIELQGDLLKDDTAKRPGGGKDAAANDASRAN